MEPEKYCRTVEKTGMDRTDSTDTGLDVDPAVLAE